MPNTDSRRLRTLDGTCFRITRMYLIWRKNT
jgi:hypothetical protein